MTYRILSMNGVLGYSFPEESLKKAMQLKIDMIADDCGFMDAGLFTWERASAPLKSHR